MSNIDPISNALRKNVEIRLEAMLAQQRRAVHFKVPESEYWFNLGSYIICQRGVRKMTDDSNDGASEQEYEVIHDGLGISHFIKKHKKRSS